MLIGWLRSYRPSVHIQLPLDYHRPIPIIQSLRRTDSPVIIHDPDHLPNANRVAFWVESRDEVDRLARVVRSAGARNVSGPKDMPEYTPTYYAVFFEDPWGNPLEVVHAPRG